jgi:pyruvate dehydrogenase E1 component alpha subunit
VFAAQAVDRGLLAPADVEHIDREAEARVDAAIAFAEASPLPAPEDALTDVYVAYH